MGVNVKDAPYRAAGDGSHDDHDAIQSAINAVAESGGGTVDLSAGLYLVSRSLAWTEPNVYLRGDGAAVIAPSPNFVGAAVVSVGAASLTRTPTYRGGIENIEVALGINGVDTLVGVALTQTWFTRINLLRVTSANGQAKSRQTAFLMHGGALTGNPVNSNWSANNSVRDLQVNGSFKWSVRHSSGGPGGTVNGTNYFGGFAYGTAVDKSGSTGFRIDDGAGDTTRVYGMALEDFDVGAYVGFQNNGTLDFRIEDCNTPYAGAPGVSFSVPALTIKSF